MFNKNFQKIFTALLLIIFLFGPTSGTILLNKAEAASDGDKRNILNGAGITVGAYYALRCTFIGRVTGASDLLADLENSVTDFFKNFGKSLEEKAGEALSPSNLLGGLLDDSVPVNVKNFSGSAKSQIGAIESASVSSDRNALCSALDRAISSVIKQQILNSLVNDVTDWIKRGYKGKVIVSDWKDLVRNAGDAAVGQFAKELGAGFLCSPFNLQVRIALQQPQRFDTRAGCTLTDIVNNLNNFYTNFRSGDWLTYQTVWAPQNNFYGATLLAWNEQTQRISAAKLADSSEAQAGQGFLSQKNCVQIALPNGQTTEKCTVTSPGSFIGNAAAEALVRTPVGSILTAEELSGYVEAIVTTAINELVKGQVDQLKRGF